MQRSTSAQKNIIDIEDYPQPTAGAKDTKREILQHKLILKHSYKQDKKQQKENNGNLKEANKRLKAAKKRLTAQNEQLEVTFSALITDFHQGQPIQDGRVNECRTDYGDMKAALMQNLAVDIEALESAIKRQITAVDKNTLKQLMLGRNSLVAEKDKVQQKIRREGGINWNNVVIDSVMSLMIVGVPFLIDDFKKPLQRSYKKSSNTTEIKKIDKAINIKNKDVFADLDKKEDKKLIKSFIKVAALYCYMEKLMGNEPQFVLSTNDNSLFNNNSNNNNNNDNNNNNNNRETVEPRINQFYS